MFPGGRVLSPPPTSHPFLVHVQNYGGRVPPILLDGCWQSTFTLFFLNLMTVLQLVSNQVVVIPWRLAFTPRKDSGSGFALWILKFAFWKNHLTSAKTWCDEMRAVLRSFLRVLQASPETISQKSGVELLDPLLGLGHSSTRERQHARVGPRRKPDRADSLDPRADPDPTAQFRRASAMAIKQRMCVSTAWIRIVLPVLTRGLWV